MLQTAQEGGWKVNKSGWKVGGDRWNWVKRGWRWVEMGESFRFEKRSVENISYSTLITNFRNKETFSVVVPKSC